MQETEHFEMLYKIFLTDQKYEFKSKKVLTETILQNDNAQYSSYFKKAAKEIISNIEIDFIKNLNLF